MQSLNPATGEIIATFTELAPIEITTAIDHAGAAFIQWRSLSYEARAACVGSAAHVLRARCQELAIVMTQEMGKPITQSIAEIQKCATVCDYYADNAATILSEEVIASDASRSFVRFDPLGVILAVMPWNFPFWQVFRFAAPALMAGNTCLLKHASNVPRCALLIEDVFREAGLPEHCFRTLLIGSSDVQMVIEHPAVAAVTLTGSEAAGSAIASIAGRVLKKTVLELGGSDPFIVLKDADLQESASAAAAARLINTGQSCIAAKRFIVEEAVADEFEKLFVEAMLRHALGDPMDSETSVGAMAREDLLLQLDEQVRMSVSLGASVLLGGKRSDRPGAFYEPTVVTGVKKGMPVYDQEVFGPVAAVIRVQSHQEAVEVANDSIYGLGASVWTQDVCKAEELASMIEAGSIFINGIVKSDPRLPFGGVKKSGYGRELSHYGIKEFVNVKTVWRK